MDQNTSAPATPVPELDVNAIPYAKFVGDLIKPPEAILATLTADKVNLIRMVFGIAGEASGELLDAIKKHTIYNQPLDTVMCEQTGATIGETILEELGDISFFLQGLMNHFGYTHASVQAHNKAKLEKRYKGKYSDAAAKDRADKKPGA